MTQAKLTSDKGEVLFAEVDSDGDYYIKTLDHFLIASELEGGRYPGWSVELIIELPEKNFALVAGGDWRPYQLVDGDWYEIGGSGNNFLTNAHEVRRMMEIYGLKVVYEGYGDVDE